MLKGALFFVLAPLLSACWRAGATVGRARTIGNVARVGRLAKLNLQLY